MGILTSPFKDQSHHSLARKFLPYAIYVLLPIAVIRLYLYTPSLPQPSTDQLPHSTPITITTSTATATATVTVTAATTSSSSPSPLPPFSSSSQEEEIGKPEANSCDFTSGDWVQDKLGPLYNGTTCGTIKKGQNCITHGRSDLGYLHWRWKPKQCQLPRFEPNTFLEIIRNKHIAFVGDSMARNQLESLLCLLATASPPKLVYTDGEENKFRRWHLGSHNATISVYWSPFLVKGVEKSHNGPNYNKLYLDQVNERWARDMEEMDMILLSVGHWFLHPAVYYDGDSVMGCHYCPGLNHTEIGFYDVLRKAVKTTLKAIIERRGANRNGIDVILTTFSPAHFEGEWDKIGACSKAKPYKEGEKQLEGMDAEMRQVEIEEVEAAKRNAENFGGFRLQALDVTKLSLMRPDAHPGPYMNPFPFADAVPEKVQNDCVHWCLPGAIDTWNEILLVVLKKWNQVQ